MTRLAAHLDTRRTPRRAVRAIALAAALAFASPAPAQYGAGTKDTGPATANRTPHELEGAGIDDNLGQNIPLDLEFVDSTGKTVKLADYFQGDRPVLLNMVYFECPMLCTMALTGTLDSLKQVEWTAGGEEFTVVTVSFNPEEGPELASEKRANYLAEYGRDVPGDGWAFLTGTEPNITKLADSLGFRYQWVEEQNQYSHAAALYVLTPDGKISQALGGIMYDPETVRLSLVEASGGKIGTLGDVLVMFCGRYDPVTGKYQWVAMRLMQLGALATIAILSIVLMILWRLDRRKRHLRVIPNNDGQPFAA